MYIRLFSFAVIILSINVVSVQNFYFNPWSSVDSDTIEADLKADLEAAESVAADVVQDIEDDVGYAAAEAQSGISSIYDRLRGKLQDVHAKMSSLFDLDINFNFQLPDYYMNQLYNLAPEEMSVVRDMLSNWTTRAQNFAQDEWEFRKKYLIKAKEDLKNTINALNNGDYDSAMDYFQSAMRNVRDETAIYRALQYAWDQDQTMIPLVSNLSASLLEFDLSTEVEIQED